MTRLGYLECRAKSRRGKATSPICTRGSLGSRQSRRLRADGPVVVSSFSVRLGIAASTLSDRRSRELESARQPTGLLDAVLLACNPSDFQSRRNLRNEGDRAQNG